MVVIQSDQDFPMVAGDGRRSDHDHPALPEPVLPHVATLLLWAWMTPWLELVGSISAPTIFHWLRLQVLRPIIN